MPPAPEHPPFEDIHGATITTTGWTDDDDEPWPYLELALADGTTAALVLARDPEGNGPGWAFLES